MSHRAGNQIVEAGEVIGGRRQRKTCAARHGAVPDRLESAFIEQLSGRADQRIPATFALGGDGTLRSRNRLRRDSSGRSDDGRRGGYARRGNDLLGSDSYLGSEGSLGSHSCSHLGHGASQAGAALPFRTNTQESRSREGAESGTL